MMNYMIWEQVLRNNSQLITLSNVKTSCYFWWELLAHLSAPEFSKWWYTTQRKIDKEINLNDLASSYFSLEIFVNNLICPPRYCNDHYVWSIFFPSFLFKTFLWFFLAFNSKEKGFCGRFFLGLFDPQDSYNYKNKYFCAWKRARIKSKRGVRQDFAD